VDRWERKRVLGQWGVRDEDGRERAERELLERELEGEPFRNHRVRPRPNHFRPSAEGYALSRGGPLPYMVRLREIEAETRTQEEALELAWGELAEACAGDAEAFERRWRRRATRWDFGAVNDLIERHNRFYPIESRLPMDVRRRDYALVNGRPYRRDGLGAGWILERFPAELVAAARSRTAA
jgi:hypothetical protein